jgi:hypothetical protein
MHTKTPWVIKYEFNIFDEHGRSGGHQSKDCHEENIANAAFIVRACNAHTDLLVALRLCIPVLGINAEMSHFLQGFARTETADDRILKRIQGVIERAEGRGEDEKGTGNSVSGKQVLGTHEL